MARITHRNYDRRVMIAMSIYVALFLSVWPLARGATELWTKVGYALTPVLPLLYVIWLMAQRILNADELEQRTHLIGLGVGAAVVSIFSIVSGFLAAANVLALDYASLSLVWIFPLLMMSYGLGRTMAARRYGVGACEDDEGMPLYIRFLYAAAIFCLVAAFAYYRAQDESVMSTMLGMAAALFGGALFFGIRRWRRRHRPSQ